MEEWKDLIGKEIKIIFEDGPDHISKKDGNLISFNETHLIIKTYKGTEGILISKIMRFEVADE